MHNSLPLISIVIPTRNRIPYCISTIESILNNSDSRLELVIHDNSDSCELESYVTSKIMDSRLRYRYTSEPLSTIDNFNAGMDLSTGEYVCFIGDDDGINPEILIVAEWARRNGIDVVSPRLKATYLWPGIDIPSTLFTNVVDGTLTIYPFNCKIVQPNLEKEVRRFMKGGGLNYLDFNFPKVYHGLVKRECMETVKRVTGGYFGGLSADIFSSMAIFCSTSSIIVIDYPLTIAGSSAASETTHSNETSVKRIEDAPHFRHRTSYKWNNLVFPIYSGKTIWLESGIAALTLMGRSDLVRELNIVRFSSDFIISYRTLFKQVLKDLRISLRMQGKSVFIGFMMLPVEMITNRLRLFVKKAKNRIQIFSGFRSILRIHDLRDMKDTTLALENHLKKGKNDINTCLAKVSIRLDKNN